MFVGICTVDLHIGWAQSLKDKRQPLQSIINRLRNKFNVSIAEVDAQDLWQSGVLGISTVSNSEARVRETLEHAVSHIEEVADVVVVGYRIEVV